MIKILSGSDAEGVQTDQWAVMSDGVTEDQVAMELLQAAVEVIDLVIRKRRDYGTSNIAMTGLRGIATRSLDKVARLVTLTGKTNDDWEFENLDDTLRDLCGYSLIGLNTLGGGSGWTE